jgi:hypothetical protein
MQSSRTRRARPCFRLLALLLVVGIAWFGAVVPAAHASVVSSEAALAISPSGDADRARVDAFLARADVCAQLEEWGVDAEQARARVALLTDQEAAHLAAELDRLPAGGNAVVAIVTIAVVLFLILIFLDAVGVTDIFPWVNKPKR